MHNRSVGYETGLDWVARLGLGWTGGMGVSERHLSLRCLATAMPTGMATFDEDAVVALCLRCGWIKAFRLGIEATKSRSVGGDGDGKEPSTVITAADWMTCNCSSCRFCLLWCHLNRLASGIRGIVRLHPPPISSSCVPLSTWSSSSSPLSSSPAAKSGDSVFTSRLIRVSISPPLSPSTVTIYKKVKASLATQTKRNNNKRQFRF